MIAGVFLCPNINMQEIKERLQTNLDSGRLPALLFKAYKIFNRATQSQKDYLFDFYYGYNQKVYFV